MYNVIRLSIYFGSLALVVKSSLPVTNNDSYQRTMESKEIISSKLPRTDESSIKFQYFPYSKILSTATQKYTETPNLYDFVVSNQTGVISNPNKFQTEEKTLNLSQNRVGSLDKNKHSNQIPFKQKPQNTILDFIKNWENSFIFGGTKENNFSYKNEEFAAEVTTKQSVPSYHDREYYVKLLLDSAWQKLNKYSHFSKNSTTNDSMIETLSIQDSLFSPISIRNSSIESTSPEATNLVFLSIVRDFIDSIITAIVDFITALLMLAEMNPVISILLLIAFVALFWKIIPAFVGKKKHHGYHRSFDSSTHLVSNFVDILSMIETMEQSYANSPSSIL